MVGRTAFTDGGSSPSGCSSGPGWHFALASSHQDSRSLHVWVGVPCEIASGVGQVVMRVHVGVEEARHRVKADGFCSGR